MGVSLFTKSKSERKAEENCEVQFLRPCDEWVWPSGSVTPHLPIAVWESRSGRAILISPPSRYSFSQLLTAPCLSTTPYIDLGEFFTVYQWPREGILNWTPEMRREKYWGEKVSLLGAGEKEREMAMAVRKERVSCCTRALVLKSQRFSKRIVRVRCTKW